MRTPSRQVTTVTLRDPRGSRIRAMSRTFTRRRGSLATDAIAYLLPVIALVLTLAVLSQPISVADSQAAQVAKMNDDVAEADPDVVILGNSGAGLGIDEQVLEKELGLSVVKLTVPHSQPPIWYAVLKKRILEAGYAPSLVIAASPLRHMLSGELWSEADGMRLMDQLQGPDAVVEAKVLGGGGYGTATTIRMEYNRNRIRTQTLSLMRDVPMAALFPGRVSLRDNAATEEAFNEVFSAENTDWSLSAAFAGEAGDLVDGDLAESVDHTLIPDIIDVADALHAKIVFVRLPVAPGSEAVDLLPNALEREFISLLNDRGAGFTSMDPGLRLTDFQDHFHLTASAAKTYTKALATELEELGALGRGPMSQALMPRPVSSVLEGSRPDDIFRRELAPGQVENTWRVQFPPSLSLLSPNQVQAVGLPRSSPVQFFADNQRLKLGRHGRAQLGTYVVKRGGGVVVASPQAPDEVRISLKEDGLSLSPDGGALQWIYPGTKLTVSVEEGWPLSSTPLQFLASMQMFGNRPDGVTLTVRGKRVPLRSAGGRMVGVARLPNPPKGPWKIEIESPPDGPFLAVVGIATEVDGNREHFLNYGRDPVTIPLKVIGDRSFGAVEAYFDARLPRVPPAASTPTFRADGTGIFKAPGLRPWADPLTTKCSPFVVVEDQRPLQLRHKTCRQVKSTPGAICHDNFGVHFKPQSKRPMSSTYTLKFDRSCVTKFWLMPGETVSLPVSPEQQRRFVRGANKVEVSAMPLGDERAGYVRLVVMKKNQVKLDTNVTVTQLDAGHEVGLDSAVTGADSLTVHLTSNAQMPLLVRNVALMEYLMDQRRSGAGGPRR